MNYPQLVADIRASKDLGHGSCSWVDECLTDEELEKILKEIVEGDGLCPAMKNPTPRKVLRELRTLNRIAMERL